MNTINITVVLSFCLTLFAGAQSKIQTYAERIDKLVLSGLKKQGQYPNRHALDDVFLRRVYVDTIGRIPTLSEVKSFQNSTSKNKRSLLISKLMNSEGFVSHSFNYWADVLRATTRLRKVSGSNYISYLKDSIRTNKPYDKLVKEMLNANGSAYKHGNGATGYLLRDAGMPLDNLANTMQVFLGTSMVCAQCHDHPFDRWTQMDFYKLAAFNSGISSKNTGMNMKSKKNKEISLFRREAAKDVSLKKTSKQVFDVISAGVSNKGTGLIRLPHDYDNVDDDHKPFEVVKAEVPYGDPLVLAYPEVKAAADNKKKKKKKAPKKSKKNKMSVPGTDIDSRGTFADWVTSKKNPMFTKVIVNRMWDRVMGAPLIGSLTNISVKSRGVNPLLLAELEKQMIALNYDLKAFLTILYNTKSYQRTATERELSPSDKYYFPGPLVRRLSAEQMWDSLISLAIDNPDAKLNTVPAVTALNVVYDKVSTMDSKQLISFIRKASAGGKSYMKSFQEEANSMMKSMQADSMQDSMQAEGMQMNQKSDDEIHLAKLTAEFKKNKNRTSSRKLKEMQREISTLKRKIAQTSSKKRNSKRNDKRNDFVRASELPSPAKPGHFLGRFGQSSRLVIDDASHESSVPQALTLMNGKVEDHLILNKASFINRCLDEAKSNDDKIRAAFLSILCRRPTNSELFMFRDLFEKDAAQARKDLIWVLVNSHEFMFNK